MMYDRLKHQGIYSCVSEEARKYNACYGDINYVDNVLRYIDGFNEERMIVENGTEEWNYPLKHIRVTSQFGMRFHPIAGESRFHGGVDFACTEMDTIYSVAGGEVTKAVHSNVGYGNYVKIKHAENEYSLYAHLSSINVSVGDKVDAGANIGQCGTTGSSTGTYLHLEHITRPGQPHHEKQNPLIKLGLK
jgi:murein DD-endopeptidase MepM/ murein hydrolase activator NlpD